MIDDKKRVKLQQLRDLCSWFNDTFAFSPTHYALIKTFIEWIDNLLKTNTKEEEIKEDEGDNY